MARAVWHANLGPIRTPQVDAVFEALEEICGAAQGGKKIAFGNTWVIAALVILSFRVSRGCDLRCPVVDSVADGTLTA